MSTRVLGIRIDTKNKKEALALSRDFLLGNKQRMIFTPNPETLVAAQQNAYFKQALNDADLNLCDGKGIQFFAKEPVHRITGADYVLDLCALAAQEKKKIYILGGANDDLLKQAVDRLKETYPELIVAGYSSKLSLVVDKVSGRLHYDDTEHEEAVERIIMAAPDILFVAFGHEKQELWIYEQLPNLPSVKIAIGVGGSFDFIAGKTKRAPKILRNIGLEWFWRLLLEPKRIKRIFTALIVFPYMVMKQK